MCGIIALWDPTADAASRRFLAEEMSRRLVHRGPDGHGKWEPPGNDVPLVLAHRRLAIRGLGEQGAQPMQGDRGVLVYNGELFGAEALRDHLQATGVVLRGTSDTEILLRSLETWGMPGTLERVRGQFAFVWWDRIARKLYVARDRVGIRPVYLARAGERLAVVSEQKALLALSWVDATPSVAAMLRFLLMGRTDDVPGETLLAGIRSLPPGHWAVWDGDALRVERYHRFSTTPPPAAPRDVRKQLERAVAEQLVSDVPIGATVSGGLDSSTVALLADRERLQRDDATTLHLFAYHDRAAEQDERSFQEAVIRAIRSPHRVHWVSSSPEALRDGFESYLGYQEEPYGDVSSYAEKCLAQEAQRHGVKVLLSGLGGDEVFVGYPTFFGPLLLDVAKSGSLAALRDLVGIAPKVLGRPGAYWFPLLAAAYHALPARLRNAVSAARNTRGLRLPLSERWTGIVDAHRHWHPHDGAGNTNAALRGSIESWCIPRFLAHSDRMGLAHGVEGRVPLLDEGVIEAAFGIPPKDRVSRAGLKTGLRDAVADVLPPAVRDRAWKLGFHAPLTAYVAALEEPLRTGHAWVCEILNGGPAWENLAPDVRWRWGNLGAYLAWVRGESLPHAGRRTG
ncbi:MAG TPA: asparagine synthase (glutamine-hydrolyzing) [Myxococcota bacterium]|nr:asparagine synthase (glutamine-hydrolyzing) [Myxococcota bacterium]